MFDFRANSLHRTIGRISNAEFMESKPLDELPLPSLFGVDISRFLHDTAHSQLLGTSKVPNGSVLTYLVEASEFCRFPGGLYESAFGVALRAAYASFKQWLKDEHLQATQPRFTPSRLNRKHRGMFPCLASKAINGKRISFWLAGLCVARVERLGGASTELDKLVATTMWSYCAMLRHFDTCGIVLTPAEAQLMHRDGMLHLLSYSHLRKRSSVATGRALNRTSWSVLPKHHHLQHSLDDALTTLINPGSYHLLAAESFVGTIGRMSRFFACTIIFFE